jgi:hypothetical protein
MAFLLHVLILPIIRAMIMTLVHLHTPLKF